MDDCRISWGCSTPTSTDHTSTPIRSPGQNHGPLNDITIAAEWQAMPAPQVGPALCIRLELLPGAGEDGRCCL